MPKSYNSAETLINDPEINAIYVTIPPASHEAYAMAALTAGKHVYLEKSMTLDSEGTCRIWEKAKENPGKLVIAHYRRELPAFKNIKKLLEEGWIGQPLFADIYVLQPQ